MGICITTGTNPSPMLFLLAVCPSWAEDEHGLSSSDLSGSKTRQQRQSVRAAGHAMSMSPSLSRGAGMGVSRISLMSGCQGRSCKTFQKAIIHKRPLTEARPKTERKSDVSAWRASEQGGGRLLGPRGLFGGGRDQMCAVSSSCSCSWGGTLSFAYLTSAECGLAPSNYWDPNFKLLGQPSHRQTLCLSRALHHRIHHRIHPV